STWTGVENGFSSKKALPLSSSCGDYLKPPSFKLCTHYLRVLSLREVLIAWKPLVAKLNDIGEVLYLEVFIVPFRRVILPPANHFELSYPTRHSVVEEVISRVIRELFYKPILHRLKSDIEELV